MASFSVDVQKFAEKLDVNLSTVVRRCAAQLYADIIKMWPVDTGYSRRNWQVSADTPLTGVIGAPPPKTKGHEQGVLAPLYESSEIPLPKDVTVVFLVNNVVYAERLEYGWSKQAPNGAVRIAIASLQAEMDTITANLDESA